MRHDNQVCAGVNLQGAVDPSHCTVHESSCDAKGFLVLEFDAQNIECRPEWEVDRLSIQLLERGLLAFDSFDSSAQSALDVIAQERHRFV